MTDKKVLAPRQEALLNALTGEAMGDIRRAMDIAGYSKNTSIREAIKPIQDEVIAAAQMMMAINAPKAAAGMVGLLDDPNVLGARNLVQASKEILDRAGVVKREQLEVKGPEGGIFILPPKQED